jgi:cytochrome oxidase complex assembly protein 1
MSSALRESPRRQPVIRILAIVFLITVLLVVALVLTIFNLMDRRPAHVCGLALVKRSPAAVKLIGSPIEQHGITGGRTSFANGDDYERLTFWVRGPLGDAFVVSEGDRSPIGSHLDVRIGRNGEGETIYSGPFDCPELHR